MSYPSPESVLALRHLRRASGPGTGAPLTNAEDRRDQPLRATEREFLLEIRDEIVMRRRRSRKAMPEWLPVQGELPAGITVAWRRRMLSLVGEDVFEQQLECEDNHKGVLVCRECGFSRNLCLNELIHVLRRSEGGGGARGRPRRPREG